jgi:hypothetical protein
MIKKNPEESNKLNNRHIFCSGYHYNVPKAKMILANAF